MLVFDDFQSSKGLTAFSAEIARVIAHEIVETITIASLDSANEAKSRGIAVSALLPRNAAGVCE